MPKKHYSFSVIPDDEGEPFHTSKCTCHECLLMHYAQLEWDKFKPKTALQRNMKNVIAKLEKKYKK